MPTELQQVLQFFRRHEIPLSTEWLDSCIEWCKDGNLPPNYTITDLTRAIFEQWMILDLRDVEVASLPRSLSNEKKYCLTGNYCLQVMQVVDISKPKLWQLQRIRNNVAKNTEADKDFGKRVLQLTLTDGVQEVEAMEFQPIRCLNINLLPGTKIRIIGPIMVRNGRLMVKEENVKHLGGAVDEMRVQFAAENVLARALRLEENPNPNPIDENVLEIPQENTTTQMIGTANPPNHNATNQHTNLNQNYQAQSRNNTNTYQNTTNNNQNTLGTNQNITRTQNTVHNRQNVNQEIPPEFQVDDDLLRELEADFEDNPVTKPLISRTNTRISNTNTITSYANSKTTTVQTNSTPNKTNRSRLCSSPDLFDEMEYDDELLNEHLDQIDVDHVTSYTRSTDRDGLSNSYNHAVTKSLDSAGPCSRNAGNAMASSGLGKRRVDKNAEVLQDLEISSSSILKHKQYNEDIIILDDDSFDNIDIDTHLDNIDKQLSKLPSSSQRRKDVIDRVSSPELKSRMNRSNNFKTLSTADSICLSLKKPLTSSKKLTQGTLNFESSKRPSSRNVNVQEAEDDNPFSIFKGQPHRPVGCRVPDFLDSSKSSQIAPNINASEFKSKHFPSAISSSQLPVKSSNSGTSILESRCLPSTSSSTSNLPQNQAGLAPEPTFTSPPSSSNILSIEKLKKMLPNIGKGKFKIKGKFKVVAEKLQCSNRLYYFVIVVEDISGNLEVQLHSDLVASIVGTEAGEFQEMREPALHGDKNARGQIKEILTVLYKRCMKIDNVLELQVIREEKYPVVINII